MSQDFAANNGMITAAFVQQFHDLFEIEAQQKESRLVQAIHNRGSITGYSFTINDMGSLEIEQTTQRFADTKWSTPETGTRIVDMNDYQLHVPVEFRDLSKLIADPRGSYMSNLVNANNRLKDKLIYRALLDVVRRKTVVKGTPTDIVLPAEQKIAEAGNVITKAQIIRAKVLFRKNECDNYIRIAQDGDNAIMQLTVLQKYVNEVRLKN